jgi:hypothetical protein
VQLPCAANQYQQDGFKLVLTALVDFDFHSSYQTSINRSALNAQLCTCYLSVLASASAQKPFSGALPLFPRPPLIISLSGLVRRPGIPSSHSLAVEIADLSISCSSCSW